MSTKRSLNVGLVGLGNMGVPIVRNLAFKARSAMYVQVHSRSLAKARKVCDDMSVDGVTCALRVHDRYSTMTKWCDVILLTLAHRDAAERVLLTDDEALLPHARSGQLIVDHTTVDVALSRECARVAAFRGAVFLDAPMCGSPRAAFNGQLVLMVGGDAEAYQRLLPIFRMYADAIHYMGEAGSGTATKLLSQALVASHNAAAAEAMTLANRLGIEDGTRLVKVLDASWGASTMLRRNAPTMQDLIRNSDKLPPTSGTSVQQLLDDLALLDASLLRAQQSRRTRAAVSAASATPLTRGDTRTHGSMPDVGDNNVTSNNNNNNDNVDDDEPFPVLDASLRMLASAADAGVGAHDMSAVVHYIQAAAVAPSGASSSSTTTTTTSTSTSLSSPPPLCPTTPSSPPFATATCSAAAVATSATIVSTSCASQDGNTRADDATTATIGTGDASDKDAALQTSGGAVEFTADDFY